MIEVIEQRPTHNAEQKWLEQLGLIEMSGKDREEGKCKVVGLVVAGTLVCWSVGAIG
jgi:hypothetical protein